MRTRHGATASCPSLNLILRTRHGANASCPSLNLILLVDRDYLSLWSSRWANYVLFWIGPRIWRFSVRATGTDMKVLAEELAPKSALKAGGGHGSWLSLTV